MKILVIRFSSIGDIVLTTPVVRVLKLQKPESEIHFLTKASFESLLAQNPYVDKVHVLRKEEALKDLIKQLKAERFDYVIDLHHNLRTLKIKKALGVEAFSFNKLNIEKWFMVNLKLNFLPKVHIVDRYLATLSKFNIKNDNAGLDFFMGDEVPAIALPPAYIAIAIGANHATKKLPISKWIEICKQLPLPFVLLGGKSETDEAQEIISKSERRDSLNLVNQLSLSGSAYVTQKAKLLITHDTGLMHIGAALKVPILSIWGNTIPEFGMYPYYGDEKIPHIMQEVKNLSCRPCSKIGYDTCPKGHFKCMEQQSVEGILRDVEMLMG